MSVLLLDEKVLGALLAAAVSALAAVGLWATNKRWERQRADALRREKVADLMQALLAEIEAYVHLLALNDLEAHLQMMTQQMKDTDTASERFIPVVPREAHDTVYRAFLPEIHLLPGPVVSPMVRYYNQLTAIANLAEDMSTDRFARISGDRMAAMYRHFIVMKQIAQQMGEDARQTLRHALGLGYVPFSTPAVGRSGPGSEQAR